MSYDLYLNDPVTKERLNVPSHMMYGCNIPCRLEGEELVPIATDKAYLNVTYNYSPYYCGAFPAKPDPEVGEAAMEAWERDRKRFGIRSDEGGIRAISGLSGAEAVPFLREMIRRITEKYQDIEGWITTTRKKVWYENLKDGSTCDTTDMFVMCLEAARETKSLNDAEKDLSKTWLRKEQDVLVSEGDTKNYWDATAANALKPLHQLIALSQLRPDGVWSEES